MRHPGAEVEINTSVCLSERLGLIDHAITDKITIISNHDS